MNIKFINSETILLFKGEKKIKVKATSKRKAHYRTIKTSDKPKKSRLENQLNFFENSIKNQDFESVGVYDENGNIVFQKDGEKDRVVFNEDERLKCRGQTMTHNHPIGHSFSPADIRWACQSEMKEMRVISKSGERFTMAMEDGSNFNIDLWNNVIGKEQFAINNEVHDEFINAINNKEMTIQEANDAHWDTVWRKVVKRVPELKYNWVI